MKEDGPLEQEEGVKDDGRPSEQEIKDDGQEAATKEVIATGMGELVCCIRCLHLSY